VEHLGVPNGDVAWFKMNEAGIPKRFTKGASPQHSGKHSAS